jgi:hypothetical protein
MKRLFIVALLTLCSAIAVGQTFSGIPLSGNVDVFRQKLATKGFVYQKTIASGYLYTGKIANEKVDVYVMHTRKNRYVYKVVVYFPENFTFERLIANYEEKVAVLISKYGEPSDSFDYFTSPYFYGDGYELQAVSSGNYTKFCVWTEGVHSDFPKLVQVSRTNCVMIMYENTENVEIKKQEDLQQMQNGL